MSKTLNQLWNSTNAVEYIFQKENGVITPIDRNAFCSIIHLKNVGTVCFIPEGDKRGVFHKVPKNKKDIEAFVGKMCVFANTLKWDKPIALVAMRRKHKVLSAIDRERE